MRIDKKIARRAAATLLCAGAAAGLLVSGCNTHPVDFASTAGAVENQIDVSPGAAEKVDILWVIDNSGSMCEEQTELRDQFSQFIEKFARTNTDFHIGVTTTHYNALTSDPVAQEARLQSTPQPVPAASFSACHLARDADGNQIPGDYTPIRESIELAVGCTADPSQHQGLLNPSDAEIEAALNSEPPNLTPLFPPYSAYKTLPKVLKFDEYVDDQNNFDRARLEADFRCISAVGTQGYGIERGLSAAVEAVSPELAGEGGPNAGFLRPDAQFGLIFVTDENDCSDDGRINDMLRTPDLAYCGDDICEFENSPGKQDSALLPIDGLAEQLRENLSATKGVEVTNDDIVVGSIHGAAPRFDGNIPQSCPSSYNPNELGRACIIQRGEVFGGDRYDRFLREFTEIFPERKDDPNALLDGWMCNEEFGTALVKIADKLTNPGGRCIDTPPFECAGAQDAASCPGFQFANATPACEAFGTSSRFYCTSGVRVELRPKEGAFDSVEQAEAAMLNSGYCVEASIGDPSVDGGCVVKRDHYLLNPCAALNGEGLEFAWNSAVAPNFYTDLRSFNAYLRYTELPLEDEAPVQ